MPEGKEVFGYVVVAIAIVFVGVMMTSKINFAIIDGEQFENLSLRVTDPHLDVSSGVYPNSTIIHKFGAGTISSTVKPITTTGTYRTPTSPVQLQVKSSSANDNNSGSGARKVTILGLNSTWDEITQVVTMNGLTPVQIPIPLVRMYRWYVSESGTYAIQTTGSHVGSLTIEETTGGLDWSIIPATPYPFGQSQIGVYSVPRGKKAYLVSKTIFVDSSKTADIYFFKREFANDTTSPYQGAMRLVEREIGISGGYTLRLDYPNYLCDSPCDVGFMGIHSVSTADVSAEFELVLTDI